MKDFEQISHTADLQLQIYGASQQELFTNALKGMFHCMRPRVQTCHYQNERIICDSLPIKRAFGMDATDMELLLVDFLSYALYLCDVHSEIYLDVAFQKLNAQEVAGNFLGVAIDGLDGPEIKAVTYHDLAISQEGNQWQAVIVFDI